MTDASPPPPSPPSPPPPPPPRFPPPPPPLCSHVLRFLRPNGHVFPRVPAFARPYVRLRASASVCVRPRAPCRHNRRERTLTQGIVICMCSPVRLRASAHDREIQRLPTDGPLSAARVRPRCLSATLRALTSVLSLRRSITIPSFHANGKKQTIYIYTGACK